MRILLTILCAFFVLESFSQSASKIELSGIVLDNYSMPLQGVSIINVNTGKVVRTDSKGFFKTEFSVMDSLLIYHIAFKKQFVNKNETRKKFNLEPEVFELMQVDVMNKSRQNQKNLDSTMISIKELAPTKTLSGYDERSTLEYFVDEKGTHNKGFSPYFGPSFHIPFGKNTSDVIKREERRQIKELTSHYHLVKSHK